MAGDRLRDPFDLESAGHGPADSDPHDQPAPLYGARHGSKPIKAIVGLCLLFAISLAFYTFNVMHRSADQHHGGSYDTAHAAAPDTSSLR